MKIKVVIVMISIVTASLFVSGGYGFWQKELIIKGDITVIPEAKAVIPVVNSIVPNANNVEVNANSTDTKSSGQTSGAVGSVDTNTVNSEQSNEQANNNIMGETKEQEEAIKATEQIEESKSSEVIVPSKPTKETEQITQTQAPAAEIDAPNQIIDVSKPTESKDVMSAPQSNVGDER